MKSDTQQYLKKNIAAILTIVAIAICVTAVYMVVARIAPDYYPETAIITEVNEEENYIMAISKYRTFIIYETAGWYVGDFISIMMDGRHTAQLLDDEIVNYHLTDLDRSDESLWLIYTKEL